MLISAVNLLNSKLETVSSDTKGISMDGSKWVRFGMKGKLAHDMSWTFEIIVERVDVKKLKQRRIPLVKVRFGKLSAWSEFYLGTEDNSGRNIRIFSLNPSLLQVLQPEP
ncbi:hypothetical protein Tco_1153382 [Tanacetum coccineum]